MRITNKALAAMRMPEGKADSIVWDSDLHGFGVRSRNGKRTFIVQYRVKGGSKHRRMTIADCVTLTADQARKRATEILAAVKLGGDPQAEKSGRKVGEQGSLIETIKLYLAHKRRMVRAQTQYEAERYLLGPIFKPLHPMGVDHVQRRDVASCLSRVETNNGIATAVRARSNLSAFYAWAVAEGLAEANPVIGTRSRKHAIKARERVLSDNELAAIWKASGDDDFGRVVRLLILTGARRQEIGGMVWSELDLERGTWTLPGERSKNHRSHTLPLNATILEIIKGVPQRVGRDQLFGSRATTGFTRWPKMKKALDARLGEAVAPWCLHDLRRSAATKMADIGIAPHVIEQILNHQSGHKSGVAGIYNRSLYEVEVRRALSLWADHIRTLVEGGERKVVNFPQPSSP